MELVELLYFFGVCLAYRDLPLVKYLMARRPGPAPLPAFLQSSQAGAETEFSVEQYQASGIPRCIGSRCCKWFLAAVPTHPRLIKSYYKSSSAFWVSKHSWLTSLGSCWGQLGSWWAPQASGLAVYFGLFNSCRGCSLRPRGSPLNRI